MNGATDKDLHFRLVRRGSLAAEEIDRLFDLLAASYDAVPRSRFESDLAWKDYVLLLEDGVGLIRGFSTLAINPGDSGAETHDVLYSGDTIIEPSCWGTQELVRGFCHTAGRIRAASPEKKLFWYLLSKGHRTYLYLPLFFRAYHPSASASSSVGELQRVAEDCSRLLFGDYWIPDRGILRFPQSHGHLKPVLAEDSIRRRHNRHVAFFLERNPGYAHGDELVCATELAPSNMKRSARFWLEHGMQQPLVTEINSCIQP